MKKIMMVVTMMVMVGNVSASVECEKVDGRWIPKNELAVKIATKLNVKTCTGKKFKKVVEQLGETSNVVKSSGSASVEDIVAELKASN